MPKLGSRAPGRLGVALLQPVGLALALRPLAPRTPLFSEHSVPAALHSGPLEWLDGASRLWELGEVRGQAYRGDGQGSQAKQTWVLVLLLFFSLGDLGQVTLLL